MMLCKLSVRNIRRSLRDYAIYFVTLIIGVAIFYVFNSIDSQAAMIMISESKRQIIRMLVTVLSAVSVFVAGVLGLLIVYASRFLIKRRNKEFAMYMLLGMGKGKISEVLLLETIIIGVGSLGAGLLIGICLSQFMSAIVANLFDADMTAYRFTVSGTAIVKTIIFFAISYLVVMIFNSFVITKMKLIDLMQSGKRSEKIRLKNPVLCIVIFIIASAALGYAYYVVCSDLVNLSQTMLLVCIVIGIVSTFFIFWSVSGMILRVVMSMKGVYYRGLNAFTFRQISSKVNTMVFSMTVICLMLFVTICALSSAFSIRNSMNKNLKELCPVDYEVKYMEYGKNDMKNIYADVTGLYSDYGYDINEYFSDYVHFHNYCDEAFTFGTFLGDKKEQMYEKYNFIYYDDPQMLVRLSDYNALMQLYGRTGLELGDDEYIIICDYRFSKEVIDGILTQGYTINVCGHELHSRYDECQDGFVDIAAQHINNGIFIVPDTAVDESYAHFDYVMAKYKAADKKEYAKVEQAVKDTEQDIRDRVYEDDLKSLDAEDEQVEGKGTGTADGVTVRNNMSLWLNTKTDIADASIGLGAMVTFLGLYIGLVFLIACGAILALKELSESVDSIGRYDILRKIGVEESTISGSLFVQTGIFFLLPLILAGIHSIFGMRFSTYVMEILGTANMWESIVLALVIILLIYGGYFLITFFNSKRIINGKV